jgi:hypothetical protein
MAEIRFNYGDKFTQTSDSNTGIGSTIPAGKLDIAGGTSAGSLRVSGIATLSSYQGFVNTKLSTTENLIVEAGQSGSVSGEVVVGTGQTISVSTGATTGQGGIQSLKVYETFMPPVGGTADRPTDVKPGMVYYNKDFKTIEFWDGNFWKQVDNTTRSCRGLLGGGAIGPSGGGSTPTNISDIRRINISSQGNAVSNGDLLSNAQRIQSCGSGTRAIWGGGYTPSNIDVIQYRAFASDGNSIDFGDMSQGRNSHFGSSSSTRALFGGGYGTTNSIDYIQINTLGNSLDFGDLSHGKHQLQSAQSPTRCVLGGGTPGNGDGIVNFIKFASKGNSIRFGDLTFGRRDYGGGGNSVRGLYCGGAPGPTTTMIEYITIASEGNGNVFGDLTVSSRSVNCIDSQTRTLIIGRSGPLNTIDFVTIATAGNAVDFGDDIFAILNVAGSSDSHGGLGGF